MMLLRFWEGPGTGSSMGAGRVAGALTRRRHAGDTTSSSWGAG